MGVEMRERDQKREHKLAIICQCREQKKCSKSHSSNRQGQHWWSELFVFLLTSFIPNEMCNQSDVVLRKHFTLSPRQHPQTHNWFPNTKRQTLNPYSIIPAQRKKKNDNYLKKRDTKTNKFSALSVCVCVCNHALMSIIPKQTDGVRNWQRELLPKKQNVNIKKRLN